MDGVEEGVGVRRYEGGVRMGYELAKLVRKLTCMGYGGGELESLDCNDSLLCQPSCLDFFLHCPHYRDPADTGKTYR